MSSVFKDAIDKFLYPIKEHLEDQGVSEVMINGPSEIFVEKKGLVFKTDSKLHNEEALVSAMRAIAQSVGRRIDKDNPRLDADYQTALVFTLCFHRWRKMERLLPLESFPKKS